MVRTIAVLFFLVVSRANAYDAAEEALQGNRFSVTGGSVTNNSSAERDSMLFVNLSTNTKIAMLDKMYMNTLSSGQSVTFRFYGAPVVTSSGTFVKANNMYAGHSNKTKMESYGIPTISNRGTLFQVYKVNNDPLTDFFEGRVIIPPGIKMLLTTEVSAPGTAWSMTFSWIER